MYPTNLETEGKSKKVGNVDWPFHDVPVGEVTKEETKEQETKLLPQFLSALAAGMGACMQGTVYAFPTRALPLLTKEEDLDVRLDTAAASWFGAMYMASAIVSSPLGGILSNKIGRRFTFFFLSTLGCTGWILTALSPNVPAVMLGRLLTVIASSSMSPSIGVYISETVHCSRRGSLAAFQSLFLSIGMMIILGIGYCLKDWRNLAWICVVPGLINIIMMIFLHETPSWLLENGKPEEARKSLQFARGKDYDISEEFDELSKQIEKKAVARVSTGWTTTIRRIFSSAFLRPFSCVGVLFLIQQWGEFSNLMIHMIEIFRDSNLTVVEPTLAPVIVGSVQVVSATVASLLMARMSPKVLFLCCMALTMVGDLALATYSYCRETAEDSSSLDYVSWLSIFFVTFIVTAQSAGCIPCIQMLLAEVFPSDIRTLSMGLTYSCSMGMGAANILIYPYLIDGLRFYGTYYFYATVTCLAISWGWFTIPDNRGLSLAKVEANFDSQGKKTEAIPELGGS